MTAELTERRQRRRDGDAPAGPARTRTEAPIMLAPATSLARVDLLPPIVEIRRRQRKIVRLLVLGLIGLVLISAVVAVALSFLASAAESTLAGEQQRSQLLKVEQRKFADVTDVKSQLQDHESAQTAALFAETDVAGLMRRLDGVLPAGISLTSEQLTVKGVSANDSGTTETTGLDAPGVIEIAFTATAKSFDSPTPLLNALQKLTGHVSATVNAVSASDQDGYVINGIVQLNADALGGTARVKALDPDTIAALHQQLEDVATGAAKLDKDKTAGDGTATAGTDGSAGATGSAGEGE